jgi:hypothetical protein
MVLGESFFEVCVFVTFTSALEELLLSEQDDKEKKAKNIRQIALLDNNLLMPVINSCCRVFGVGGLFFESSILKIMN